MPAALYSAPPDALVRAPDKTIAFTGAAALGEAGTAVPVWTTTGRVLIVYMTAFITEALVSTANLGTIALGTAAGPEDLIAATTVGAAAGAVNDWWNSAGASFTPSPVREIIDGGVAGPAATAADIIITPATQNITDGTLIMSCYYIPLTAGASLS